MSRTLPDRVAGLYYAHGLFCSSYPYPVLFVAISVVLLCCYPLGNLPMPGNVPRAVINQTSLPLNNTNGPAFYIQQVALRVGVIPWKNDLALSDAFRGPLYEVFNLLEIIQNYQDPETSKNLGQVCLHVEDIRKKKSKPPDILPEYNCLVLSPANLWRQSLEIFNQDTNILGTIFSYQNLQKGKNSIAEMAFGMNLKETGVKRYPVRVRQRILQYAVTIFLKEYDPRFINGLKSRLTSYYSLHQSKDKNEIFSSDETLHIIYPGEFNYNDFFPLMMTFVALFFYVYFSMRKIELVKSKITVAICATLTVILSLSMTIGVCFFFGLTMSMSGKEIFPYLVIIVGLENVLVLTKSVVSTPTHLDVKIRVAQGLSKEGWSITKNLLTEVTILTIGLFTFVPAIQEFCICAIVGLLNDFFLQIVVFSTILALDTRKTELSGDNNKYHYPNIPITRKQQFTTTATTTTAKPTFYRSKSHPKLNGMTIEPTNIIAPTSKNQKIIVKLPKRLRLVHFWARTRIFQRAFMVWMVVWISMIIYNSSIVEQLIHLSDTLKPDAVIDSYTIDRPHTIKSYVGLNKAKSVVATTETPENILEQLQNNSNSNNDTDNITDELNKLRPVDFPPWNRLSLYHWSSILNMYNISVAGEQLTILPTIKLSHAVNPQLARQINNPNDIQHFQWQSLATAALDPLDFSDIEVPIRSEGRGVFNTDTPFVPSSPMEIFLAALLCLISVIVVAYTMVVLYRCICSRNYAEWRASWYQQEKNNDSFSQVVLEALPLSLEGHSQEIECVATDGDTIASTCLSGHIKIWDSISGDMLTHINRKQFFNNKPKNDNLINDNDELMSDYESGSPPSRGEIDTNLCSVLKNVNQQEKSTTSSSSNGIEKNLYDNDYKINNNKKYKLQNYNQLFDYPNLRSTINTKFSTIKYQSKQTNYDNGFDYGDNITTLFKQYKNSSDILLNELENNNIFIDSNEFNNNHNLNDSTSSLNNNSNNNNININNNINEKTVPSIWCIDYQENILVVGCANGVLEFWEGTTGRFKCYFDDGSGIGISSVKLIWNRVIAAKLNGSLDFLELERYNANDGNKSSWGFTSGRRTHVRTGSAGSPMDINNTIQTEQDLRCLKKCTHRAHQQAITVLDSEGGRVLTGSQDHTLKVFRLEDQQPLYTLHGHCGPISCLFIDRMSPMTSGSGSQDGLLCVWDLLSGTCVYSIQAHDGSVAAITCSASYVISIGTDERLCVWERFQGHLLHALPAHRSAYSLQLIMLTHNLLITSNQGSLIVWDVSTGEPIKEVRLGHKDSCVYVKQMISLRESIVCDFGRQLRIVKFPLIFNKTE